MTMLDLKGWLCVTDDGDDTIVRECVGFVQYGERSGAMLRNPATREVDCAAYLASYTWFAPEDRAAAEAYAAKLIAEYNAPSPSDDEDETEEAA